MNDQNVPATGESKVAEALRRILDTGTVDDDGDFQLGLAGEEWDARQAPGGEERVPEPGVIAEARRVLAEFDAEQAAVAAQPREPEEPVYTVFCREASGEGTIYISSDSGTSAKDAARKVLAECAQAWGMDASDIEVIGIAEGDVNILEWSDDESGGVDLQAAA